MTRGTMVVDDHLLLRILLGDEPEDLRPDGARVVTTGLWYHRLCRALRLPSVTGALSRQLGRVDPALGAAAVRAVAVLPDTIGLVSFRELAWPMADLLGGDVRLNLLSMEALAAAEHLGAELCLADADENPPLLRAAGYRGVPTRLVTG